MFPACPSRESFRDGSLWSWNRLEATNHHKPIMIKFFWDGPTTWLKYETGTDPHSWYVEECFRYEGFLSWGYPQEFQYEEILKRSTDLQDLGYPYYRTPSYVLCAKTSTFFEANPTVGRHSWWRTYQISNESSSISRSFMWSRISYMYIYIHIYIYILSLWMYHYHVWFIVRDGEWSWVYHLKSSHQVWLNGCLILIH